MSGVIRSSAVLSRTVPIAVVTSCMGVVGLAAILYSVKLPLSIAEAVSLNEALRPTAAGKPPLYFLLLHYWLALAPPTELWLKFSSVLFATLSVPAVFGVGRAFLGVWPAAAAGGDRFGACCR